MPTKQITITAAVPNGEECVVHAEMDGFSCDFLQRYGNGDGLCVLFQSVVKRTETKRTVKCQECVDYFTGKL